MLKKISLILLVLAMLLGCEQRSPESIVDQVFLHAKKNNSLAFNNNTKGTYSYYLPLDVGIKQSNRITSILQIDGYDVVMSLDVASILLDKQTDNFISEQEFIVDKNYRLSNHQKKEKEYHVIIEEVEDYYLLILKSEHMTYGTLLPLAAIESVLTKMLIIARSELVDTETVIEQFSNKEIIDYEHEIIEIFTENIPESGYLNELSGQKRIKFEGMSEDGTSD